LEASGIDETTVFPDLDGLGRALNVKWLKERVSSKLPHVGVYTRPRPSRHHGVGVFAVRDIKAGARLFDGDDEEMVWISRSQLTRLPREIMRLYADFAVMRDGKYGCPKTFNRLTVAWYLNESRAPNVRCDEQYDFFAMRKIKRGEELTVDYSSYSDGGNGLNRGRRRSARNRTTRTRKA